MPVVLYRMYSGVKSLICHLRKPSQHLSLVRFRGPAIQYILEIEDIQYAHTDRLDFP